MKYRLNLFLALMFLLASSYSISQGKTGKYIQFKLYKNAQFALGQTQATRTVTFGNFSPAIAWGEDENFNELQLTSLNFSSRARAFSYSAGAEYTYNYRVSDEEDSKFHFFVGGGLGAGFSSNYSTTFINSTQSYNTTGKFIRAYLLVIPRVTYEVRNNILIDLSVPYHLYDFQNSRLKNEDPSLPVNQQTTIINDNTFLPRILSVKLGGTIIF